MAIIIDYLIVGRTPLGSAVRAGLIGVLATTLGTLVFSGTSGPLVVGVIIVLIVLPLAYALSKRDNPLEPAAVASGEERTGSKPTTPNPSLTADRD